MTDLRKQDNTPPLERIATALETLAEIALWARERWCSGVFGWTKPPPGKNWHGR